MPKFLKKLIPIIVILAIAGGFALAVGKYGAEKAKGNERKLVFQETRQWQIAADATVTSSGSGNWNSTAPDAPWPGGTVPATTDDVVIASGHTVTIPSGYSATAASLTFNAASTANGVALADGTSSLTITNATTISAPTAAVDSTLAIGAGTYSTASITINGGAITGYDGVVSLSTGTITASGNIVCNTANTAQQQIIFTGAGTMNVGGNFASGSNACTLTGGTGLIKMNGSAAQILGDYTTYNNLEFANTSGGVSLEGTTTAAGNFTVTSGTVTAPSTTLTIAGNYSNSGTFTHNSGTVTMNAGDTDNTFAGTMTGASSFYNLTFNNAAGRWTFGNNSATVANDFIITASETTTSGITAPGSGYTLIVGGNFTNTAGKFTHNSGTVNINSANGWNYKKAITLSNEVAGELTNYQVKVIVDQGSGTDGTPADTVYCGTNCKTDFGDIRFTDASGVPIDYWMEGSTSPATFWVEVPSIASGVGTKTVIYMLSEGSGSSKTTTMSGGNTFIQWHGAATSVFHDSNVTTIPFVYEGKAKVTSTTDALTFGVGDTNTYGAGNQVTVLPVTTMDRTYGRTIKAGSLLDNQNAPKWTIGTWYYFKIIAESSSSVKFYVRDRDNLTFTHTNPAYIPLATTSMGLIYGLYNGTGEQEYSFIRQYVSTEPTKTYGAQTSAGGTIAPNGSPFYNITFNGLAATFGANSAVVSGNFTLTAGTVTAPSTTLTIAGNFSNSGTFTHNSGTVDFNKSSATQTLNSGGVGAGKIFNNLTHSGAGTLQLLTNAIDVDGNFSQTAGIFDANSLSQNYAGNFSLSAGTTYTKGGTLTFDGATQVFTDSTAAPGQDLGAVTIGPSTATSLSTANKMHVTTLTSGTGGNDTFDISGDTLTISGTGTPFTQNGAFTVTGSTVVYDGTGATNITSTTYNNLNLGGAATTVTYTAAGDIAASGILTIVSSSGTNTFDASNRAITLSATGTPFVINASEVFTPSTSTVSYIGNGATNISSTAYYTLNIGAANSANLTYTALGNITANNNINLQSAAATYANTFDLDSYNFTVGSASVANSGGIAVPIRSTFNQDGGAATVKSSASGAATIGGAGTTTFNNFTIGTASDNLTYTFNLGGAIAVSNDLDITAGGTGTHTLDVTGSNYGLTVGGNWTNSSTFTKQAGTVTFGSGWSYKKAITLTASGSSLTNYQVKIIANAGDGTDGTPADNVYCGTGHCRTDAGYYFGDVRFTDSSGAPIDYWMETSSASAATFWVEVPSISTSGTVIYMLYGNAGASTTSNGGNTFQFFDDFNRVDGAVGNGWATVQDTPVISSNTLRVAYDGGSGNTGELKKPSTGNSVWEWSARLSAVNGGNNADRNYVYFMYIDASNSMFLYQNGQTGDNVIKLYKRVGGVNTQLGSTYSWSADTNWHNFIVTRDTSGNYIVYYNGSSIITATDSSITTSSYIDFLADLGGGAWTKAVYIDDIRVRQYAATEPTKAWGSETAYGGGAGNGGTINPGGSSFYNTSFNGYGGTFGANPATVANNFTITAGTVTAPSTTLSIAGNYSNAGTFTHNSGEVIFNGNASSNQTVTTAGQTFNKFTVNNTQGTFDQIIISGNLDVNNTLSITDGNLKLDTNNPAVYTAGDVSIASAGSITKGTGAWTFYGATTASWTDNTSGGQDLGAVNINSYDSGLVGKWKLDGGITGNITNGTTAGFTDSSGNGNNGTFSNVNNSVSPTTRWIDGPSGIPSNGGAVTFDGVDDYVQVTNFNTANDFTISVWVKLNELGRIQYITEKEDGANKYEGTVALTAANKFQFIIDDGTNFPIALSDATYTTGAWYHVVGVRDTVTDKLYLYVNGASAATPVTDTTTASIINSTPRRFGAGTRNPTGRFFNGSIDEPRVYNRALSQLEIQNLYSAKTVNLGTATSAKATSFTIAANQTFSLNGANTLTLTGSNTTPFVVSGSFTPSTGTVKYEPATAGIVYVANTTYHDVTFDKTGNTFSLGVPDLVGEWNLDGGASGSIANNATIGFTDSSASGNNGTAKNANGTGMAWTTGPSGIPSNGGAVTFDGVDDYVSIADQNSLDITNNITISAWIKPAVLQNYMTILAKRSGTTANYVLRTGASTNNDELEFFYHDGTSYQVYTTSDANLAISNWYNISVVYTFGTASSIKIYKNGQLLAGSWTIGTGATAVSANAIAVTIGSDAAPAEFFNGSIDEPRVYNRALTQAEIQKIYTYGGMTTDSGGDINILNGTLDDGGFQITGNATGTLTAASGTILKIGGASITAWPTNYTAGNTALNSASTVIYNSNANQTISGTPTYGNLRLSLFGGTSAPTKTAGGNLTVNSNLTIDASNTLDASNKTITLFGSGTPFVNNGTFTPSTSTVKYTGTSATNITAATYNNLELVPAGTPTYTLASGTVTANGYFTVGNGTNAVVATAATNNPALSVGGNFTIATSSTFVAPGSAGSFTVGGSWTNSGTFTNNGGTVTMNLGWSYKKKITLSSGTALTNYQVKVIVNSGTGADGTPADNVYCGGSNRCKSDFGDIRFTDANGNLIDYWMENSTTPATFWVEVPSIANGTTDIYMLYGNSGATTTSNGGDTFDFYQTGLIGYAGYWVGATPPSFGNNYAMRGRMQFTGNNQQWGFSTGTSNPRTILLVWTLNTPDVQYYSATTGYNTIGQSLDINHPYKIFDIIRNGTTNVIVRINDGSQTTHTYQGADEIKPETYATYNLDWTVVRKYTATEPTKTAFADSTRSLSGTMTTTSSFNNLTFNDSGTAAAWSFGANPATVANNFTITAGTVATSAALEVDGTYTISAAGIYTAAANADLTLKGNVTLADGSTFTKATGTGKFILEGDAATETFNDQHTTKVDLGAVQIGLSPGTTTLASDMTATSLTINASDTLITNGYDLDIGTGGITINSTGTLNTTYTDGEVDRTTITDEGNFTNNGTFTYADSTVTIDGSGTSQLTYSASTIFYNLTENASAGKIIEFDESAGVQTIIASGGSFNFQGADCTTGRIYLRSIGDANDDWEIDASASGVTTTVKWVDLQWSKATAALTADASTDEGDANFNWTITNSCVASSVRVSGTVYQFTDETLPFSSSHGAGTTVQIKTAGTTTSATVMSDGSYSKYGITTSDGGYVLVYLDGGTYYGSAVTIAPTVAADITSLNIFENALAAHSHKTGTAITNANIIGAESGDPDDLIGNASFGSNLIVDSGYEFHVAAGKSYTPGGALTIQGAAGNLHLGGTGATANFEANNAIITGNVTIDSGATLTAPNASASTGLTIGGNYSNSGTFTHNSGTVVFDDASKTSTISGNTTFYNLTSTTPSKSMTFSDGSTQTIAAGGALTLNGGACNTKIFLRKGSGAGVWTLDVDGTAAVSYIDIKDSAATHALTAANSVDSTGNTGWTFNSPTCGTTGSPSYTTEYSSGSSAGPIGTVLNFDGANDYLSVSDNAALDQPNALSFSVWIKPKDASTADEYILYRQDAYYIKKTAPDIIVGAIWHTSAWHAVTSTEIRSVPATWTHIEMTYNKNAGGIEELKLYLNGILSGMGDHSTAIPAAATKMYIGAGDEAHKNDTPENFFDGKIGDLKFYQYARSAEEVRVDYNSGFATLLAPVGRPCSNDPASCMDYGLVGYWNMDEGGGQTAKDLSNGINHLTLGFASSSGSDDPKWTKGKKGNALKFDGANDYAFKTDSATLSVTGDLAIEAWIKLNKISTEQTIVGKWDETTANADRSYRLWIDSSNKLNLSVSGDGTAVVTHTGTTTTFAKNTWYYVTGVYDTSAMTMDLYVNAVLDAAQKASGVPAALDDNVSNLYIGAKENIGGNVDTFFNGTIDDVRIYDPALSPEEIDYHYSGKIRALGLSATAGNAQVVLSWLNPSYSGSVVTGYNVYRSSPTNASYSLLASGGCSGLGNVTTCTDASLTNGTVYYYKISAVYATGEGSLSSEVSAIPDIAPAAVNSLATNGGGDTTAQVTWSAPTGNGGTAVLHYHVYCGTSTNPTTICNIGSPSGDNVSGSPFNHTGLTNGTTYYYKVAAVNVKGEGTMSSEVSATPGYIYTTQCAGINIYYADLGAPTTYQWKTSDTACDTPQCGINGGQDGDNLVDPVANPSVDFSLYPAQNACKAVGGRLPTKTELNCIYTNKAALGTFPASYHRSSTEYNAINAWGQNFNGGLQFYDNKTYNFYVRCVRGQ